MADAAVRRKHPQRLERGLRPAQEGVALAVARELELGVAQECVGHTRDVGDDRVVDHKVDGNAGLDHAGVAAELDHGIAHCREVDDRGHAGEVLHQDARGHELQLACSGLSRRARAIGQRADVVGGDVGAVFASKEVLEQDS